MDYSPILALATAAFEIVVVVWAFRGPGERPVIRTTTAVLGLLACYQIVEVAVCSNVSSAGFFPRLAFIVVTWLPPLGLLLIAQLHRPRSRALYGSAYAMLAAAAAIVAWIALDRTFALASVCNAVYARYLHAMPRFLFYSWFYWIGLFGMTVLSGYGAAVCTDGHRRRLLFHVFAGTVGFVAPSVLVSYYVPPARGALPSIMCHFALILAVFLARMVLLEQRAASKSEDPAVRRHVPSGA